DKLVTGVQTCALPIWRGGRAGAHDLGALVELLFGAGVLGVLAGFLAGGPVFAVEAVDGRLAGRVVLAVLLEGVDHDRVVGQDREIGRASCRERVEMWG